MLKSLLVILQAIANNNGQTLFFAFVSLVFLCGDPGYPAAAAATNSVSQQACQSGCIFHTSSGLYVHIKQMEFKQGKDLLSTAQIEGCFGDGSPKVISTDHSVVFTYSYGNETEFFNISMIFWKDVARHNWSLVMVSFQSSDDPPGCSRGEDENDYEEDDYYYGDRDYYVEDNDTLIHQYPFWVGAAENTALSCNSLAGVSNNTEIASDLYIHDITIQPFNADENNPPSKVTDCTAPNSHRNNNIILILGAVAVAAVVIAIVIVTSTYFYRQRKRGKYNLLD